MTTIDESCNNPEFYLENADLVVSAAGVANVVKASSLKKGSILINVGFEVVEGNIQDDINVETAKKICGLVSKATTGVGAVNVSFLVKKVFQNWANKHNLI